MAQTHVATLVTSLSCIGLLFYHFHFHNRVLIIAFPAYTLNLRGSDIPYNPLFHSYLFISLDKSYLFVESAKLHPDVIAYLNTIDVEQRNYTDLWPFLRRRLWGEGKVLIAPQTSYAISLMLTHVRYTVAPSYIEMMMSVKNETEIDGMKRAYLRDGVSYVRFFLFQFTLFLVRLTLFLGLGAFPRLVGRQTGGWLRHHRVRSWIQVDGIQTEEQTFHGSGV